VDIDSGTPMCWYLDNVSTGNVSNDNVSPDNVLPNDFIGFFILKPNLTANTHKN
jgi:hypothetical protein